MEFTGPTHIPSQAVRKIRLINFDTSYRPQGYSLKPQHKPELDRLAQFVAHTTSFGVWIVGFASKRGNHALNKTLSANRALAVEQYLKSQNPLFGDPDHLDVFDFVGDEGYRSLDKSDNSADERAVEVHIFLGDIKPVVPGNLVPRQQIPLPGGPRFSKWEIASPGGLSAGLIGVGGVNIFVIKNTKLNETRQFLQIGGGLGGALGLSGGKLVQVIVALLTAGQFPTSMTLDFVDVGTPIFARRPGPPFPVTWEEVEGCLIRVASAGAGLGKGASFAVVTFASSGVYHYGPSDFPIKEAMDLWEVNLAGENFQLGVNASEIVGPLFRLPFELPFKS
ncbi:MAG TPA: OmpA family protein [Paraburkholderia sp.]